MRQYGNGLNCRAYWILLDELLDHRGILRTLSRSVDDYGGPFADVHRSLFLSWRLKLEYALVPCGYSEKRALSQVAGFSTGLRESLY
jgi:hypothetical protein